MNFRIRPSNVLKKLRNGEVVNCFKANLTCPRVIDIIGMYGFDCLWMCLEHTVLSWSQVESQIYAAKAHDMDVMVRVPKGSYNDYIKPLELDASGIMVPHLMSAQEARDIVHWTRFHPVGLRPADGGNADGKYCNIPFTEYIKQANEERFVIVQIEDVEPLDELDEICSVEGIDMVFFGPGDFSQSVGTPGDFSNPRIAEARELVVKTALKHGKFAGTTGNIDTIDEYVEMGYKFVAIGADVFGLSQYCGEVINKFYKKDFMKTSGHYGEKS